MYSFNTIVAYDSKFGIGKDGKIPWDIPTDLYRFKQLTTGNVVIMGRKTYESIGKPLNNRINIIISKTLKLENTENLYFFNDIIEAFKFASSIKKTKFVIGGQNIYKWFLDNNLITTEYVTKIYYDYNCDVFYPKYTRGVLKDCHGDEMGSNAKVIYEFWTYDYKNQEEALFLTMGRSILNQGESRDDRTGTGTLSAFGKQLTFDLSNNTFPLLTTRKMFLRGIFEELMLYLRGQTDSKILEEKKINVWQGNTTREFLDKRNLQHLPVGDMGPSYGFLFRHFGAKYIDCKTDYTGQGADQLANVIHLLKTNTTSRRIIISLWDPVNIDSCPLPPCLYNYQFYVANGELSCMMTQRSSDYAVAGGWNIATGALLTIMLAQATDLKPKTLIWNIGDMHLYKNVIDNFKLQLKREPYIFPKLYLPKKEDITTYEFKDLQLINYNYHDAIDFHMNV